MNSSCMSWFSEYLSAILQALRKRAHVSILADGKEVKRSLTLIMSEVKLLIFYITLKRYR